MRTNDEIMDILDNLKQQKDLSISEIARRVGMAKSAVSRYFSRTREFPLNKVNEFAQVFDVTPEYILGLDDQPETLAAHKHDNLTPEEEAQVNAFIQGLIASRKK